MSKTIAFVVYSDSARRSGLFRRGVVLLEPRERDRQHIERTLSKIGIYAPRGADRLLWKGIGQSAVGTIKDASGKTIVRLRALVGALKITKSSER